MQNRIHRYYTRIILLATAVIINVFTAQLADAATYFVSVTGNDSYSTAQAQNINTPWETIQKAASNMTAGDICKIKGGIYRETVTVPSSGTSGAPLTFQAYGDGDVVISGTATLPVSGQSWTLESSNIYYTPMNWTLNDGNQIFIGGAMKPEARWPNAGTSYPWQNSLIKPSPDWSYATTVGFDNGYGWLIDSQLPSKMDGYWNDCTMHIMSGCGWIMSHPKVTNYVNSSKKLTTDFTSSGAFYGITIGNEYYLTGKKEEMDSPGEWFYDSSNSRLYTYSLSTPSNVESKKRNYGFILTGKSYISLINLNFFACTIQIDSNSTNCIYDGLRMQYLNHSSKNSAFYGLYLANGCVLRNSELSFDSQGLIRLCGNDIRVINNHLHDSGYVPYWTAMVDGTGYRNLISHNTLHDSGRALQGFPGKTAICEYNNMYNAMKLTTDGGILYSLYPADNAIVRYNLLHDSPGPQGHSGASVQGFYLDCFNNSWIVHHNIIWNVPGYAMQINDRHNFNMIFNNTCWNALKGSLVTSFLSTSDGESGTRVFNNLFNNTPASDSDIRYNLYSDPLFVNAASGNFQLQSVSSAIDKGTVIPGIADSYNGNAPDMGALEYNGTDWTASCGHNFTTPPSPDPTYTFPNMIFCNKIVDGSFETNSFSPNWTTTGNVSLFYQDSWGGIASTRSGYYSAKLSSNGSEVSQTLNNLQPGRRYTLYAGVKKTNVSDNITIGVKNYGRSELVTSASAPDTAWHMYSLPFVTGASSSTAQMYVHAATVASAAYVDDVGIEQIKNDLASIEMPHIHLAFDEASGQTAYDHTINGHNGTLHGNMTDADWIQGKFGNALDFDGVDDYVTASMGTASYPTGSFTVSFWVKFNDTGTGVPWLASNTLWMQKGWGVVANQNRYIGIYLFPDNPADYTVAWSSGPVGVGEWYHVAFAVDRENGTWTRWFNGTGITGGLPQGFGGLDTMRDLQIGSVIFRGQIDDVRIYDYALSNSEMDAILNLDASKKIHLQLNEGTGATDAYDCSGNNSNGVLNNMDPLTAWVPGNFGNALNFDGVNDYLTASMGAASYPTGSFTVSFCVKFNDTGTGVPWLASNTVWMQKGWGVVANQNRYIGIYLFPDNPANYTVAWSSSPVGVGEWYHVAFAVDRENGTWTRCFNGTVVSGGLPQGFGGLDTINDLKIGSAIFRGQIDDVQIYSRALSESELLEIAFSCRAPY